MSNNQNNHTQPVLLENLGLMYPTETSKGRKTFGLYKCECGNTFKAVISSVKRGNTKSCGCYQKRRASEANTTHGMKVHPLYTVWTSMIRRCENPNTKDYKNYGGRGIIVESPWRENFLTFYNDMYSSWRKGLTIDRKDSTKNYCKENCRWVTKTVQAQNTRKIMSTNTSGYRGVTLRADNSKWVAAITVDNVKVYLGQFNTALEAAIQYDKYVVKHNLEHTTNGVILSTFKSHQSQEHFT